MSRPVLPPPRGLSSPMAHLGSFADILEPSQPDRSGKETLPSVNDEKSLNEKHDVEAATTEVDNTEFAVLKDERDIATHVVSISDDPSLNPWTFRAFFIGIGLSTFGGVLGV